MKPQPILILAIIFLSLFAHANKQKDPTINLILHKYSAAAGVKAQFVKTDFKKSLGIKKLSPGVMRYADGKINIELSGEKKSEIIYNGSKLWIIEYPDLDFDPKAKRKVTEIDNHRPALAEQISGLFQNPNKFLKNFKTVSNKSTKKITTIVFESKDKVMQNFQIELNVQKMLINSIQFTDDVQTETRIEFSKTQFLKKPPEGIFEYKRKKDDEVM